MFFELTNEQRKCMGIPEVMSDWELVCLEPGFYCYYQGEIIRKLILVQKEDAQKRQKATYREYNVTAMTKENRTILCPKTARGKEKKLTAATVGKLSCEGVCFYYSDGRISIVNENTQINLFSSHMAGMDKVSWDGLEDFCNTWVKETTEEDFKELQEFVNAKRKHCKFMAGDYFRFRVDRRNWGYGRVLLDVMAMRKKGIKDWNILMGRPVIIEVFHILTEDGNLTPNELANLPTIPSQYLMDNALYYREYQLIGQGPLPDIPDYPIMYGQSISYIDRNKIMFQRGEIYRELPLENNKLIPGDFRNNGMGWQIHIDANILKDCIEAGDNLPYWNRDWYYMRCDIRNPKHREALEAVLKQFGFGEVHKEAIQNDGKKNWG